MDGSFVLSVINNSIMFITPTINQITAALIIVFLGFIIGKVLGKVSLRLLQDVHKTGKDVLRWDFSQEVSMVVTYGTYIFGIILGIDTIGVAKEVSFFLLGIVAIVFVLSFFITAKDFIPNVRQGVKIRQKYEKGDVVYIDKAKGTIVRSELTTTTIKRTNGEELLIPNIIFTKVTKASR